jgi:hypothetical protein
MLYNAQEDRACFAPMRNGKCGAYERQCIRPRKPVTGSGKKERFYE